MLNVHDNKNIGYTVVFDLWGQVCQTKFTQIDAALRWLETCYDKGFLYPAEILAHYEGSADVVVYECEELVSMMP